MTPGEGIRPGNYGFDLRQEVRAVATLWWREMKIFQRETSRVISSLATPLLWVLIVGTGLGASFSPAAGIDYRSWLFPGVIAQAILFGTTFFGLYIVWDRKVDVLKEILVAPVSRFSIFLGKVCGGATEAIAQGMVLLIIGSVWFGLHPSGIITSLPVIVLLALGFVSVGLFIGSFFTSFEGFQVIVTFLLFPLFFLSGAIFPVEPLAEKHPALYLLTRLNPVTYAVDSLRGTTLGQHQFPYALDLAVLAGFAIVMLLLGTWGFGRMKQA